MTTRRKKQKFRLIYIGEKIDARRGYKRCVLPGVVTYAPIHPNLRGMGLRPTRLIAEFWRNRTGGLVVRFNSTYGWGFCYEAFLLNDKPVPDKDIYKFGDFIVEVLLDWGGTDDPPDEGFS
jgi:hypothetical protein